MPRLALVLAVLVLAGCTSTGTLAKPGVRTTYDSVEGVTVFASTPAMLRNVPLLGDAPAVFMELGALCPGQVDGCEAPRWFLGFTFRGDRLTGGEGATLRIGEERIRMEPFAYGADAGGLTRFTEVAGYEITGETARAFAFAPDGDVEARVMGETFQINEARRKAARLLVSHLDAP